MRSECRSYYLSLRLISFPWSSNPRVARRLGNTAEHRASHCVSEQNRPTPECWLEVCFAVWRSRTSETLQTQCMMFLGICACAESSTDYLLQTYADCFRPLSIESNPCRRANKTGRDGLRGGGCVELLQFTWLKWFQLKQLILRKLLMLDSQYHLAGRPRFRVPIRTLTSSSNVPNPSSRNVALGLTQPLTEMSSWNLPGKQGMPGS
jgi:hypothetical protein